MKSQTDGQLQRPPVFSVYEADKGCMEAPKYADTDDMGGEERAGSGVPNIFNVWEDEGWVEPTIEEQFDPDRTILILEFHKKQPLKSSEKKVAKKSGEKKVAKKTEEHYEAILNAMEVDAWYKANDFLEIVPVKASRIKALLADLIEQGKIETKGSTKGKKYKKI